MNFLKLYSFCFLFFLLFTFCIEAKGQEVIFTNPIDGAYPSSSNPYTSGQTYNANISVSGIGFGSGVTSNPANDRYNAKGWESSSLDATDYFTFTITPNSGYEIDFSNFVYTGIVSGTGPVSFAFRSSIDGFTNNIGSTSASGSTIDLSGSFFQNITSAIEFRLFAWGASSAGGTFSINNFTFNGSVVSTGCYVPDAAGAISGPTSVLPNQSGVAYSVNPINNATGYVWNLPPDALITSGSNTNSITVDFGTTSGNISVYGTNICGGGNTSPIVTVNVSNLILYSHDFGDVAISAHPYDVTPGTFATHLSSSSWSNSVGSWTSYNGNNGKAIALDNSSGTPTITLTFTIDPYFKLDITHFNFWRQRSPTGATDWSMAINGTAVGSGTSPETGADIGQTAVSNPINNLTGTVTVVISLSGASGTGTFRLDDFTLYGNIECILPDIPSNPTSNSPQCADAGVTLTRTGTPPADETWYWQTSADGTDNGNSGATFTVFSSGTYYIRAKNNISGCWSDGAGSLSVVVNPLLPAGISISADANPVCEGTTVYFAATPINGGSTPDYQWTVNGIDVGDNSPTYSYEPANADVVTCVLTSSETCVSGSPATSNELTMTVNPILPVSVSITADPNPVCSGTTVEFTATPTNGGSVPDYQWTVNGLDISGETSPTYSYNPAEGDKVTCVLTSSETCTSLNPATSNELTMTVNPILPVSVSITADANPVCSGTTVEFTATPTNGGSTPSYQWKVNGSNILGETNPTYSYNPVDGDKVTCALTSSETCKSGSPAISNELTMTVNPILPVSITIAADANPVCSGTTVNFTATPTNGGSAPDYQWKVNGSDILGETNPAYSYNPVDGDKVTCSLTSSETCKSGSPAISNELTMTAISTPVIATPADVAVCDLFTLPTLGVGNYYSGTGGAGMLVSMSITTSQTVYIYAETGTTPNCTDEHSFQVDITNTPLADDPADVAACDSYTLPVLSNGNYFTGTGGTGTPLFAGDNITSTQTIYVFAQNGSCSKENSFEVTINHSPVIATPADVAVCDLFTLPTLGVGNYYSGTGGTGMLVSESITTSQTVYIYAETGTTPNCTAEHSFQVDITNTPLVDDPADVTACDSYTLPALTDGNYYTGSGGSGALLNAGESISSTQTIYVFAKSGTCTKETSFTVTINPLPAVPANPTSNSPQCVNLGVTLTRSGTPAANETWYWQTAAGGTNVGNSDATYTVYTSGTYYLRARNNTTGCWSNGAGSLAVVVNPLPIPTIAGGSYAILGQSGNLYSSETGMTNYTWTVSAGGTITAGGGTANNSITVTWTSTGAHTVSVNYTNSTGCRATTATTFNVSVINPCSYGDNSLSSITNVTPCINYASRPLTVSTSFACNQYFTLNVIKGLNYQIYSCNSPAPSDPLVITVYQEGEPSLPYIAASTLNTGNSCSALPNNAFVSFTSPITGQVRVLVNNAGDCSSVLPSGLTINVNVNSGNNTQDNQTATATDSWIGHIYEGTNAGLAYSASFPNYLGYYFQSETFSEGFVGNTACFNLNSDGNIRAQVYTESFSVRYRMQSTKTGLWLANIAADDGVRLSVDGTLIFDRWINQSATSYNNMLVPLNGSSNLTLDYFENGGNNVVSFQNFRKINNNLTVNTEQTACLGIPLAQITGDELLDGVNPLPAGITNTWQWYYSTTPTGSRTAISGATSKDYLPSGTPFDMPGTYYLYRIATVSSTNNVSGTVAAPTYIPVSAPCESNMATVTILSPALSSVTPASRCGEGTVTLSATASEGTVQWYNAQTDGDLVGTSESFTTPTLTSTATYYAASNAGGCVNSRLPVEARIDELPLQPGAITGSIAVYPPSVQAYSVPEVHGVTYSWTFPSGWVQLTGANSNSVTVEVSQGDASGNIEVTATNTCGTSSAQTLPVVVFELDLSVVKTDLCLSGATNSGSITAVGINGQEPYQYKLNSGSYQASGIYVNLSAGNYTVTVMDAGNRTTSKAVTIAAPTTSADDQTIAGNDTWVGHVYKRMDAANAPPSDANAFTNYYGIISESEIFNETFGGNTVCIPVEASEGDRSVYSQYFAVRFRMNSTKQGIYLADIGSDDGARLFVDGTLVYNRWLERSFGTGDTKILFGLNGSSSLLLDFYDSGGENHISFQNFTKVPNTLTDGSTQGICQSGTLVSIVGNNALTDAPISGTTGYTVSYQWQEASVESGPWSNISGATLKDYTPVVSAVGVYYYRRAITVSKNNLGYPNGTNIPVTVTDYSNVATVTISALPVITTQPVSPAPVCVGEVITSLSVVATNAASYQWFSNSVNSTVGATSIDGATLSSFSPSSATSGTTYYFCQIQPIVPVCGSVNTNIVEVVVDIQPSISISGANQHVCSGVSASALTATITNGIGCTSQWQSSTDGITWSDISGETNPTYTPSGLTTSTFFRAVTIGCASGCDQAISNVFLVSVTHDVPTITNTPAPATQTVLQGANVTITCDANLGSGTTKYRLVLLSAYGTAWHGLQEIQGYNVSGNPVTLTCTGASSATYTANPTDNSAYSARQAFDGDFNSAAASGVQWLTPRNNVTPNANWQNYNTYNPFFSPEWIEWDAVEPLAEVWIYNGRYASGASTTNFKDYQILVSHDGGTTWYHLRSGTMNNVSGLDENNNKISVLPYYTWKNATTTVGSGRELIITGIAATANYFVEATYGCGAPTVSATAEVIVNTPSSPPVTSPLFTLGSTSSRCQEAGSVTYTATAENATGISYTLDATTSAFAGNSINTITGEVTFASAWTGVSEITAIAAGVGGPKTTVHTVTTLADPTVTISGGNQTICSGSSPSALTATISNGVGCGVQWQSSTDGISWIDITDAISLTYTPSALSTSTFFRTYTVGCAAGCDQAFSNVQLVSVTHDPPSFTTPPSPDAQTVYAGTNVLITGDASLGSGQTKYRLVLLSAYGAGWHGLQEIQGYNLLGAQVSLSCTAASSATFTATPADNSAYSAAQAFDGEFNSVLTSTVQWLTPQSNLTSNANWKNYTSFNPFFSPEWIEWNANEPLSEVWIYNGRYASGASTTNFKDYQIWVSHDNGSVWQQVAAGTLNNVQGIDGNNNKISTQPSYTWKNSSGTTVGTGRLLTLPNVTADNVYHVEATYGCGVPTQSSDATVTITSSALGDVETPVFVLGGSSGRCQGVESITYTATATNATGITYALDATTLAFPGNSINVLTGAVTYAAGWIGTSTITASAAGTNGPKTAVHTVTTSADPTVSINGGDQTMCSGGTGTTLTAVVTAGYGCGVQWQSSIDGTSWSNISGENGLTYTPSSLTSSIFVRAITVGCASDCDASASNVLYVGVIHEPPTFSNPPSPQTLSVPAGTNVTITCDADLGTATTRYRLVLLSAHGAGWHGLQEIQGYNLLGAQVSLSCTGASCATNTNTAVDNSAFGANHAFDGIYNSPATSAVQWLTPRSNVTPYINWRNYSTFNPFFSPEWIEWSAAEPLAEVWVYNGRYASGASATNFKDYQLLVSNDGGTTWLNVKSGTMNNVQGLDGENNKISLQPSYTWKTGGTTVGTGRQLEIPAISASANYLVEATYGCGTPTSPVASEITVTAPVTPSVEDPVFMLGASSSRCQDAGSVTYTATATNATGITYSLDATTLAFAGNSIDIITGEVTYAAGWVGPSIITAYAAGTDGPKTATHTVTTVVDPSIAIVGGNQTICSGGSASLFTATITNGVGCGVQWQSSSNGILWTDISGATGATYAPSVLTSSTFYRATTLGCGAGCNQSYSNVFLVSVIHDAPTLSSPTPASQEVSEGANATITCEANLVATRYRLVLLSAYGAGWHGIQEIQGYNLSGAQVSLSCSGVSCATNTNTPTDNSAYSAAQAFDGEYNSALASTVQWLTPRSNVSPYINYQNYNTFNPFYSPEWIEWNASEPLSEVWIYNGRYASGASTTNFKDFQIEVSYDGGSSWTKVASGTMNNVSGIDETRNKISLLPSYTWKNGASTVGTGRQLLLTNITSTSTYHAEATFGCGSTTSTDAIVTVTPATLPVGVPVFAKGSSSSRCREFEKIIYSATAENATGISYSLDAATLAYSGNSINSLTGEVTFSSGWLGTSVITVTAGGKDGPKTATHTITTIVDPVISISGVNQYICSGANASSFTATVSGSVGCGIKWQSSADGTNWTDIGGETSGTFTPTGVVSSAFYRAVTSGCQAGCDQAFSNVFFVGVTHASPSITTQPASQNVCVGDDITIACDANLGSGEKRYRLVLLSAYGAGWHGIQEIQGYSSAGSQVPLTVTAASSATYTATPTDNSAYSATQAFDGEFNSALVSTVQWLTPQSNVTPNANWKNYSTFNPFYSPEWIEWKATEPLSQVWVYNGRYASGASSTNFKDYQILVSDDNGSTWYRLTSGTMANVQGLNGNNNKISILPSVTWKNGATTVGTGSPLQINDVAVAADYYAEVSYGCTATQSDNASITLDIPEIVTEPEASVSACLGATLNELKVVATNAGGYQWYSNSTYSNSGGTIISSATSSAYTPPSDVAGTIYYYCEVTPVIGGCGNAISDVSTVTITTAPSATISYNESPYCQSITTERYVTLTGTTGGGFSSTAGLSINSSTGAIIPSLSSVGPYEVTYTVPASGSCGAFTTKANLTISPLSSGGTLSGSTTVYSSTNSALLELTGHTGSVDNWQSSSNGTDWTDFANTNTSYTATNLAATTYFRVVVQSGTCSVAYSSPAIVTVSHLSYSLERVTSTDECPELDPTKGFNPQSGASYNAGATEIVFKVTRIGSVAATWEFDYIVGGSDVTVSGIAASPNTQTGTKTGLTGNEYEIHFYILNQPGKIIEPTLKVTEARDSDGAKDETDREISTSIKAMPIVGSFN
jgi:hypothetical protein